MNRKVLRAANQVQCAVEGHVWGDPAYHGDERTGWWEQDCTGCHAASYFPTEAEVQALKLHATTASA
jgi:hypothetical protein